MCLLRFVTIAIDSDAFAVRGDAPIDVCFAASRADHDARQRESTNGRQLLHQLRPRFSTNPGLHLQHLGGSLLFPLG